MSTNYEIFHYTSQNFNDIGFGCSYRNIQNILSSLSNDVPDIRELFKIFYPNYETLIKERKTRELWIEPYDISNYLKKYHKIEGENLIYITEHIDVNRMLKTDIKTYIELDTIYNQKDFNKLVTKMQRHFLKSKIPIVIDDGTFSYCVLDISKYEISILDPHKLQKSKTIYKRDLNFFKKSFWMIYIPNI
tara:strand:+ start:431 stop:1000 length:570 start_codon:yes stop_codon:yes gene_type:complete